MKDSLSNSVAEGEYMLSNLIYTIVHNFAESHVTQSSSRLTSSDKLSALPSSANPLGPNVTRNTRSATFSTLANIKRGFRRSLDATTTSLPSFSFAEPADSPVISKNAWSTTPSFNVRTETSSNNFQRYPTPENASNGKETPKQRVSFDNDRASMPSVGQGTLIPCIRLYDKLTIICSVFTSSQRE